MTSLFANVVTLPGTDVLFRNKHMYPSGNDAQIPVASNTLLVTHSGPHGDAIILCDAGAGEHVPPKLRVRENNGDLLTRNLGEAGISLDQINFFFMTHGHWDHIGGVFTKAGEFLLPQARVVVSAAALDDIRSVSDTSPSFIRGTFESLERLRSDGRLIVVPVDNSSLTQNPVVIEALGQGIEFFASEGHAAQMHPRFLVEGGEKVLLGGDLIPTSEHALSYKSFMPQFDPTTRRETLQREKETALSRFCQDGTLMVFYHDAEIVAARIRASSAGETPYQLSDLRRTV